MVGDVNGRIGKWVDEAVFTTPVYDLHTHLYPAEFGKLMLWGIDELLTYHYLIAETIRASDIGYEAFWGMNQQQQADTIWRTLFVERAPISEACRGVLTVLNKLGVDVSSKDLKGIRECFRESALNRVAGSGGEATGGRVWGGGRVGGGIDEGDSEVFERVD
ncbi:MAG: hypothetical protein NTU53_06295 [Planctomycetota bacterium]|nr:hypothetical protein [Planctomycetota bacterium]